MILIQFFVKKKKLEGMRPEEEVDMLLILKGADKIWCWGEKVLSEGRGEKGEKGGKL